MNIALNTVQGFHFSIMKTDCSVYYTISDASGDASKEISVLHRDSYRDISWVLFVSMRLPMRRDTQESVSLTTRKNTPGSVKRALLILAFQPPRASQFDLDGFPFPSTAVLHPEERLLWSRISRLTCTQILERCGSLIQKFTWELSLWDKFTINHSIKTMLGVVASPVPTRLHLNLGSPSHPTISRSATVTPPEFPWGSLIFPCSFLSWACVSNWCLGTFSTLPVGGLVLVLSLDIVSNRVCGTNACLFNIKWIREPRIWDLFTVFQNTSRNHTTKRQDNITVHGSKI